MKPSICPRPVVTLLVLICLCLPAALPCLALSEPSKKPSAQAAHTENDLSVVSDEMIAEQDKAMVEFIGHVRATRADLVLLADSLKVFFHSADTKKQAKTNIREIIATGNVTYTAGNRKAYADQAVYTTANEVLVLTGRAPRLTTGKSYVTGKKITLFRNQERVVVESSGKKRVQAFFDAEDQQRTGPENAAKTKQ